MIVRVVHGRVPPGQTQAFHIQARQTVREVLGRNGNVCAHLASQRPGDDELVVFTTVWRDLESIYEWLGGRTLLVSPMAGPADDAMLADIDIQHYEEVGDDALMNLADAGGFLTSV